MTHSTGIAGFYAQRINEALDDILLITNAVACAKVWRERRLPEKLRHDDAWSDVSRFPDLEVPGWVGGELIPRLSPFNHLHREGMDLCKTLYFSLHTQLLARGVGQTVAGLIPADVWRATPIDAYIEALQETVETYARTGKPGEGDVAYLEHLCINGRKHPLLTSPEACEMLASNLEEIRYTAWQTIQQPTVQAFMQYTLHGIEVMGYAPEAKDPLMLRDGMPLRALLARLPSAPSAVEMTPQKLARDLRMIAALLTEAEHPKAYSKTMEAMTGCGDDASESIEAVARPFSNRPLMLTQDYQRTATQLDALAETIARCESMESLRAGFSEGRSLAGSGMNYRQTLTTLGLAAHLVQELNTSGALTTRAGETLNDALAFVRDCGRVRSTLPWQQRMVRTPGESHCHVAM